MEQLALMTESDQDQAPGQESALAEDPSPEFVYNPWKMKDVRRLYINLADGTKVGYLVCGEVPVTGKRFVQDAKSRDGLVAADGQRRGPPGE
ncbi:hypothetical protein [Arthrobacter globiformis]|uniref:hypothetical protein n=1 Tax=Arthrobacter globiformis TaxID=1665 RepID=UPI0027908E55|nr:hypothetical protein [Arthrobacter globiformis]MDQ0618515.1 hypothetical protein [Arthrobacter globiformis]